MSQSEFVAELESDPRFPSGKWVGYYLQPDTGAKRHPTELILTFRSGRMTGEGQDVVGKFVVEGKYQLDDGRCRWLKTYIGQHTVIYIGYNEGKGIWGVWEIPPWGKGGFHIWPDGQPVGDSDALHAEAPVPQEAEDPALLPV